MKPNLTKYKYILLTTAALGLSHSGLAQTLGFEQDDIIKVQSITTDAQINALTPTQKTTTVLYYDGLGRPLQSVTEQASPLMHDMIKPSAYDNLGRQTISYLPYAGQSTDVTGSYRPNAVSTDQPAFYNQTAQHLIPVDASPYSQQVFENSPLQRMLTMGMVGAGFQPVTGTGQHYKTVSYRPNSTTTDGNILEWNPNATYTTGTYYPAGSLNVTDGTDEDNIETQIFTDLAGRTVLKRQILSSGNLDTYYLYDYGGALNCMIPPAATALLASKSYNLTAAPLSNMVFKYTYDYYGRLTQKTVPAKGTMYIVYDPLSRPVLLQDANMRANNQWNYIKYDVKGRAISQGIYTDATHTTLTAMQTYVSGLSYATNWYESRSGTVTNGGYYSNALFPTTNITPLAWAYYDDYDLNQNGTADFSYITQNDANLPNEETATTAQLKGMPTMISKSTVGLGLTNTWLTTATFYDHRLHPIQVQSNNQLYYTNATTLTDTKTVAPDFTGMPLDSKVTKQTASSTTNTVYTYMTYDQVYRVTSISQKYNSAATTVVAAYSYSEAGQVIQKNLGQIATGTIPANLSLSSYSAATAIASSSITLTPGYTVASGSNLHAFISTGYLQTVDMRYNIRGQLLSINNSKLSNDGGVTNGDNTDLFGMQFYYDQANSNLNTTPKYNGRMTGVTWMSTDAGGNKSYERAFSYYYDNINRDTAAIYSERPSASTAAFTITHGWDENRVTYDGNGNIQTLFRMYASQGAGNHVPIDNLTYTYSTTSPNQLSTVTDATGNNAGFYNLTSSTTAYTYDANGNLTNDYYKGLGISYNFLNKTGTTTVTTGTNQYINYTYDGAGMLIRKQAYNNGTLQTTTDYIDGFVYVNSTLSYFPMPEGRVINNAGTLKQEFIITDQQGNARLAFQDSGNGAPVVTQENSYYAFGLIMPNSPVPTPNVANKQLYNGGSEWQNDYGNLPDYYQTFNRNYDAALGRFIGVDPQAESAESMSTYQYSGNNPVMFNDPMGDKAKLPLPPTNNSSGGDPYLTEDSDGNTIVQANSNNFGGGGGGYQLGFGGIPIFNQNYMGIPGATSTTIYNTGSDGSPAVGSLQDLANVLRNYAGNTNTGISYYFSGNGAYEGALWNGGASNNYNKQKSDYADGVLTVTYPQISETEGLALLNAAGIQTSQDGLSNAGTATDIVGGLYGAAGRLVLNGDQWLGKNGKYYSTDWGGNGYTGSRAGALEAAGRYKWAGRATVAASLVIGGLQVYGGYEQDGGQFGYHAQTAAAGAAGGLIGGWGGAEGGAVIGGIIGGAFGGIGAIPGAAIGAFIGGFFGSQAGSAIGSGAVNYYYDHK